MEYPNEITPKEQELDNLLYEIIKHLEEWDEGDENFSYDHSPEIIFYYVVTRRERICVSVSEIAKSLNRLKNDGKIDFWFSPEWSDSKKKLCLIIRTPKAKFCDSP
jgi:hypothetical protein